VTVRLTKIAKRAGCAAKHPPGYLFPLLGGLPKITDPNVLVGTSTADDAAVYRLDDERALVLTTDFFTPIVDDPYDFGAIAATNALSDVYAMGGTPLTALNIVGFPEAELDVAVLGEILRGGAEKAREAGIDIVGGHTIKTDEPIYGLAVTGMVHPRRIASNAGGRPGDLLVLTKPLGVGIITTAAKQDRDSAGAIGEAIRVMSTLNRGAAEAMGKLGAGVHACTDVTGFGLLGHLHELLAASGLSAELDAAAVPVLAGVRELLAAGMVAGGTRRNHAFVTETAPVEWGDLAEPEQLLLADAQTSGGLLLAVEADQAVDLVHELDCRGTPAATIVAHTETGPPGAIRVR
jgi:selenide,water dikinase